MPERCIAIRPKISLRGQVSLGGECVFASEIDPQCIDVYRKNYGIDSGINIIDVVASNIPQHDVLCAGFPCHSFSKAGYQLGLEDITRGTLFFEIVRILSYHRTPYIILENVRNLVSHDHGRTWEIIQANLKALGYRTTVAPFILSLHYFGIPQIRERVIILGKYDPEHIDKPLDISFRNLCSKSDNSIYSVLSENENDPFYHISEKEELVLTAWDEFYQGINMKVIGFPIWADFFKYSDTMEDFPGWKKHLWKKTRSCIRITKTS
ncbi:MAG: DNA (cytosine-5-)-methyltransferase [Erysipelotrichaceae bacterium]|nr:DNA (cytosine-5-)-methyltransferase [Erysipelotrichaceae bacterium]